MVSNKERLYIALYPSGVVNNEERKYHWGFLIGPKDEKRTKVSGVRYHVKNLPVTGWVFEQVDLADVRTTTSLLARILIAKVEDKECLIGILQSIPIVQNDPNWRCRTWIVHALEAISNDGRAVGTAELNWGKIEAVAREYVGSKAAAGRYQTAGDMLAPKPTWDMLENREIIP